MATKKRSKGGRATASRAKTTARPRATTKAKPKAVKRTVAKAKTKPVAKAKPVPKPVAKAKPVAKVTKRPAPRAAAPKKAAAKPVEHPAVVALKARFQRERNGLEKRLTEMVREIGLLRHHELRAMQLERHVGERDATIVRLQTQLAEVTRPTETLYVREVQQTLALVSTPQEHAQDESEIEASAPDLDEFEDDGLGDETDADLVNDED